MIERRMFPPAPEHPLALVIDAHPDPDSFCRALTSAWVEGAREHIVVETLALADLAFDPCRPGGYRDEPPLERDLLRVQDAIARCAHLVVTFPVWWGSTPAALKGLFDRTFLPGWAFAHDNHRPIGGLAGRSARMIVTMDAPTWYDSLVYGGSARRQVGRATLRFSGFSPVRCSALGSVGSSTPAARERMLERVRADGRKDGRAVSNRFPVRNQRRA